MSETQWAPEQLHCQFAVAHIIFFTLVLIMITSTNAYIVSKEDFSLNIYSLRCAIYIGRGLIMIMTKFRF